MSSLTIPEVFMNCLLVSTSRSQRLRSFWSAPRITILWANPKKRNKIPVSRGKEKNQNIRENLIDQPKMVLHVLNKKPFETRPLFFFSIQLFFAALCLNICIKNLCVCTNGTWRWRWWTTKKIENRWRLNSFLMSNISFFHKKYAQLITTWTKKIYSWTSP